MNPTFVALVRSSARLHEIYAPAQQAADGSHSLYLRTPDLLSENKESPILFLNKTSITTNAMLNLVASIHKGVMLS
jgi:hypothetical protein